VYVCMWVGVGRCLCVYVGGWVFMCVCGWGWVGGGRKRHCVKLLVSIPSAREPAPPMCVTTCGVKNVVWC
jgi:hypothetical protein